MRLFGWLHVLYIGAAIAQPGNVTIAPKRVVFEAGKTKNQVMLINRGTKLVRYRLTFIQMEMTPEGRLVQARNKATRIASKYVRFAPRQVTLKPGGKQLVRLMLRAPKGMSDGEFMSHLQFTAMPSAELGSGLPEGSAKTGAFSSRLLARYSIAIPVIIRKGRLPMKVQIGVPYFNRDQHLLTFLLNREGSRSVYGSIQIAGIEPGGRETVLRELHGVAVYQNLDRIQFQVKLHLPEQRLATLVVRFQDNLGVQMDERRWSLSP